MLFLRACVGAFLFIAGVQTVSAGDSVTCDDAKFQMITDHSACLSASGTMTTSLAPTDDEITEIVNRHNYHRANVDPSATNMLKMSWDEEIAMVAQAWAETCPFSHDENYARMIPGRYQAGQNLYLGTLLSDYNWTDIVDGWYSEVDHFSYGVGSTTGAAVGHYTQIVWAESYKIGCGGAFCSSIFHHLVCNYSPPGNDVSTQNTPYISGTSCSDCPNSCSGNLCDCSSQDCYNGGTLDVDSCQCTCRNGASYYVGAECALNCTDIGTPACAFEEAACSVYTNVPFDCPVTCGFCPDADSTHLLTDSGTDTATSGSSTGETTGLDYACYPNGTIEVTNPDTGTYVDVLAVQDEGDSSATECTVASSGSQVLLTGCSKDSNITIFFSNAGDDVVFVGQTVIGFTIVCSELPATGVTRIVTKSLGATLELATENPITPSFSVSSAVRSTSATGSMVTTANVGDILYWTIDIPSAYNGRPTCTAYSGTSSSGSPTAEVISEGCTTDSGLVDNFDSELSPVTHVKRIWATVYAFRFYNNDAVYLACSVKVCPSTSSQCDVSCGRRKRDATKGQRTPDSQRAEDQSMLFTTGTQLVISGAGLNHAFDSFLGSTMLMSSVVLASYCILVR